MVCLICNTWSRLVGAKLNIKRFVAFYWGMHLRNPSHEHIWNTMPSSQRRGYPVNNMSKMHIQNRFVLDYIIYFQWRPLFINTSLIRVLIWSVTKHFYIFFSYFTLVVFIELVALNAINVYEQCEVIVIYTVGYSLLLQPVNVTVVVFQ